jgi:hypothetical protein
MYGKDASLNDNDETRHARFPHPCPNGTTDRATSHLTDKTTSHSTRLSKDDNQVAGYIPQGEGDKDSLREFHVNETVFEMQSVAAHSRQVIN